MGPSDVPNRFPCRDCCTRRTVTPGYGPSHGKVCTVCARNKDETGSKTWTGDTRQYLSSECSILESRVGRRTLTGVTLYFPE